MVIAVAPILFVYGLVVKNRTQSLSSWRYLEAGRLIPGLLREKRISMFKSMFLLALALNAFQSNGKSTLPS
jgi:hypothetical protein